MKKRLEADLISIAHRILQLKNKSDINQLYLETQKLYEKLAVLRFVEEHFGEQKPTIGQAEIIEKVEEIFENDTMMEFQRNFANDNIIAEEVISEETLAEEITEDKIVAEEPLEAEITENKTIIDEEVVLEEVNEIELKEDNTINEDESLESNTIESQPISELNEVEVPITNEETPVEETAPIIEETEINSITEQPEEAEMEAPKKKEAVQISFEDLLGGHYAEPQFVKRSQLEQTSENKVVDETPSAFDFEPEPISNGNHIVLEKEEPKTITLNDKLVKGITIGLNDRIAFVKHLFGGDSEDYNRVLSQLITFDTFLETKTFIDEMVKPDYNNWEGKEDFEHRFMEIIEKKFLSF
jgi:cell envelope opacity-associated protein A